MKKKYDIIKFPENGITEEFLEVGFSDDSGFEWFLENKKKRMQILSEHAFGNSNIEFSMLRLQSLFYFLEQNLTVAKKTKSELKSDLDLIPDYLKKIHTMESYVIIEPTKSIIFDISIYFGEYLLKEIKGTYWNYLKIENRVGTNRPIIMKKGCKIECNPMWLLKIMTKQIVEKTIKEDRLIDLFSLWKNALEKG